MPKSDVPRDLGISPEVRKKLDEEAEAALAAQPPPAAPASFIERVAQEVERIESEQSGTVRTMPLDEIVIPEGMRDYNEAKVQGLMGSIGDVGLLQEPIVTPAKRLVFGKHRIEACRRLGWTEIPVKVRAFDALHGDLANIDENLMRNDLSALERAEQIAKRKRIYEALHPDAKLGALPGKKGGGKDKAPPDKSPAFIDDAAAKMGVSRRVIAYDAAIVKGIPPEIRDRLRRHAIAENQAELLKLSRIRNAEQQHGVMRAILEGHADSVSRAIDYMKRKARDEIGARMDKQPLAAPQGPFDVIVIDPPWRYSKRSADPTHRNRAGIEYPDMTLEAICELPVKDLAATDCVLWLWITNAFIVDGSLSDVLDAWGFTGKTMLTWAKDRIGAGDWLRGQTEHCVLAIRGKPVVTLKGQSTLLPAQVREHSRKPDEFYALVESLCHGSKLEMFSRQPRKGWVAWGAEAEKFKAAEGAQGEQRA